MINNKLLKELIDSCNKYKNDKEKLKDKVLAISKKYGGHWKYVGNILKNKPMIDDFAPDVENAFNEWICNGADACTARKKQYGKNFDQTVEVGFENDHDLVQNIYVADNGIGLNKKELGTKLFGLGQDIGTHVTRDAGYIGSNHNGGLKMLKFSNAVLVMSRKCDGSSKLCYTIAIEMQDKTTHAYYYMFLTESEDSFDCFEADISKLGNVVSQDFYGTKIVAVGVSMEQMKWGIASDDDGDSSMRVPHKKALNPADEARRLAFKLSSLPVEPTLVWKNRDEQAKKVVVKSINQPSKNKAILSIEIDFLGKKCPVTIIIFKNNKICETNILFKNQEQEKYAQQLGMVINRNGGPVACETSQKLANYLNGSINFDSLINSMFVIVDVSPTNISADAISASKRAQLSNTKEAKALKKAIKNGLYLSAEDQNGLKPYLDYAKKAVKSNTDAIKKANQEIQNEVVNSCSPELRKLTSTVEPRNIKSLDSFMSFAWLLRGDIHPKALDKPSKFTMQTDACLTYFKDGNRIELWARGEGNESMQLIENGITSVEGPGSMHCINVVTISPKEVLHQLNADESKKISYCFRFVNVKDHRTFTTRETGMMSTCTDCPRDSQDCKDKNDEENGTEDDGKQERKGGKTKETVHLSRNEVLDSEMLQIVTDKFESSFGSNDISPASPVAIFVKEAMGPMSNKYKIEVNPNYNLLTRNLSSINRESNADNKKIIYYKKIVSFLEKYILNVEASAKNDDVNADVAEDNIMQSIENMDETMLKTLAEMSIASVFPKK